MDIPNQTEPIPTGIADLDDIACGGFRPGQLIVIAGHYGHGASTLALGIARCAAIRHGIPTHMIANEASAAELFQRVVAAECGVPVAHVVKGMFTEDDNDRLDARAGAIAGAPLAITDKQHRTLADIAELLNGSAIQLLVIDGAHLLTTGIDDEGSLEYRSADLSRGLKSLAMDAGIPIVVTLPLTARDNRPVGGAPHMSDFDHRYSFEQDADLIVLMYRPDVHEAEHVRAGEVDLIVAKQRNGPAGRITAAMQAHYARILGMSSN